MALSPELRRTLRQEGVDPIYVTSEIEEARKTRLFERVSKSVEATSRRTINGVFRGLDILRQYGPVKRKKLLPWERWYFNEYPEKGDPRKRETWKNLKKEGIKQKDIYISYLQSKYTIPEKLLLQLADQATTKKRIEIHF